MKENCGGSAKNPKFWAPPPFKQFFVFGPHLLGCPGQNHDGQNGLASQFLQFAREDGKKREEGGWIEVGRGLKGGV